MTMLYNVLASEERGNKVTVKLPTIKCPFKCIDEKTGEVFEWVPRVANPTRCPNCFRRLSKAKQDKTLLKSRIKDKSKEAKEEKKEEEEEEKGEKLSDSQANGGSIEESGGLTASPLSVSEEMKVAREDI